MKRFATVLMPILALLFAAAFAAQAQTITSGTYAFSRSGFAPTDISTGNTQLIGANADNAASAVTDIGFTFWFAGTPYTQFSVNENGVMKLGSTAIPGSASANNMADTTVLPKIAPYWDDLATGTNGSVYYKVTGTAPNRILIINWNVTVPKNAAGAANALIQVQLSEANGLITFTYGSPALAANAGQYSIGIGASATDFASVTPTSATAATVAYGTANNANTLSPGVYTRYNFTPDAAAPTISYTALAGIASTANRTLTATIGDARTGVPVSGTYVPRIYYKKNFTGTYVSSPGSLTAGSSASGTWSFTIDNALLGGVVERDSVYYFVVAQDQSVATGSPNKASSPAGATGTDVTNLATYPASPAVYKILGAPISGTKTVGTSGADYTSLSNAGGLFTDINDGKLTGDVVVQIITDLPSETGAVPLNAWTNVGGPFTVTIKPVGARTVSSSLTNPIIKLNGAKGVTIDGLNDGTNSLTISCAWGSAIQLSLGASNNTITRATVIGGSSSGGQGVISFYDGSGTFANCSNNQITDCTISGTVGGVLRAASGIYFGSWSTGGIGTNNVITRNVIRDFSQYGIFADRNYGTYTISNNEIFQSATGNYSTGINLTCPAGNLGTTNITNNRIHDLRSGTGLGVPTSGITYSGGGAIDVLNISNNVIVLDAVTTNTAAYSLTGMTLGGPGTSNVYFNSIYIGGTNVASGNSAGIYRTNGTVNFKNNVVFNARSGAAVSQYYKNFGIAVSNLTNFNSDNNVIYANGVSGVLTNVGTTMGQSAGTDYPTLAAWRSIAPGRDAASFSGDPGFKSATDLTPDPENPNSNILNNRAVTIPSISLDAAGNTRGASADIGAYEFTPKPVFYTISGNAGVAGATLSWTDSTALTTTADSSGAFSITVPYGWSGTVTPSFVGYTFTPLNIAYSVLTANQSAQNFTAAPSTKSISGNAGMAGVTMSWVDGSAKSVTTDASGNYTIAVPTNWSGSVTPSRAGYSFSPASTPYVNIAADLSAQNYAPTAIIYTISGNAGAPLVAVSWTDTTAKTVTADLSGNYSITVSYNWSGTVTPALAGHTFAPANIVYANVLANQTAQNFTAIVDTVTIAGNVGVPGVQLIWTDGTLKTAESDSVGGFTVRVAYGWSGTITPSLTGYTFLPSNRIYANVVAAQTAQNFTAVAGTPVTISGNAGRAGVTLYYTDITPKTVVADSNGVYTIVVPGHWSGTVTPALSGYAFTPSAIPFSNVTADQAGQNFAAAAITYTISGNAGKAGAVLSWWDSAAKSVTADVNGNYSLTVSYNWSGSVKPSFAGSTFSPDSISYTGVLSNQIEQNYTAAGVQYVISGNAGKAGVTLSWTDGIAKTAVTDSAGNYSIAVSWHWSGSVAPSLAGYTFAPASIAYATVSANQPNRNYAASAITYTIAGSAGKPGVTVSWTDTTAKTTVSDSSGNYLITVSYNWSGTVTPSLAGHTFAPAALTFANVLANKTAQNFTASALTYTISGSVGRPGVTLSWSDTTAKTATSDASGNYSITVSYNWSGTVAPQLAGVSFAPGSQSYSNVVANQSAQNYTPSDIVFTISGNAGFPGATLSWTDGGAHSVTADSTGGYSFAVSYHWSGTVTPSLAGRVFTPASRAFANVLASQTAQNFTAAAVLYTISGNAGAPNVTVSWTDTTAKTVTADALGNYSFAVSYNWSGAVTPARAGYTFAPVSIAFANVLADQAAQNFSAAAVTYTISGNAGKAGVVLSWKDSTSKTTTSDASGNYSLAVSYNWSGSVKPMLAGYKFTPDSAVYANVVASELAQNFTASALTFTISGNAGKAGAIVSWTDTTAKSVTADTNGNYAITVPYNWSGAVSIALAGVSFAPSTIAFTNILADQTAQNFTPTEITYTIAGNAGVPGAVLSWTDGTAKTAAADTAGNYAITVSYHWTGTVTPSLAGNSFLPAQRSYTLVAGNQTSQNYTTAIRVNAKVFLQGPFSADTMMTTLNMNHLIPLTSDSAYAAAAFGYSARTVASIPNPSIVDWILVELRTGTAASTKKAVQAGFLKSDGTIVDTDGVAPLAMQVNAGSYYIVIRHRNHLAVMSAAPVALSDATPVYDFTTNAASAFGANPMVALGASRFGMAAGSNDGSILITTSDYNAVGRNVFTSGYLAGDHNMNGSVFIDDYNFVGTNLFLMTQVP